MLLGICVLRFPSYYVNIMATDLSLPYVQQLETSFLILSRSKAALSKTVESSVVQ